MNAVRNPSWLQCREELAFHFNWMSIYVCQKANIMHCGTLHDTCQDREMAVLCFPIPLLHQDSLVPFLTVERQKITASPSPYISLSFSLSLVLFLHFCSLFCTLTSLFHSPFLLSYFPAFPLSCTLLPSVSSCALFLPRSVFLARSASPSSSQLSCSGIVRDHSTSKYLLLTVALCSPHLDHVILKSEGTALLFSMSACSRWREKDQEQEEGKAMSPTAEPARWMHSD